MYSLGLLIVELETARRRLRYVFEVPNATPTSGLGTQPIPDGAMRQNWLLAWRISTRLTFADRMNRPRSQRSCQVEVNLDSLNYRRDSLIRGSAADSRDARPQRSVSAMRLIRTATNQ